MKKILKNISLYLATVPSMGYALTYILCIPMFALFFWALPHDFYHSTVQFENVLNEDAEVILAEIRNEIVTTFEKEHGNFEAADGNWNLNITAISVHSLKPEADKTRFTILIELEGVRKLKGAQMVIPLDVYIENRLAMGTFAPGDKWMTVFKMPIIPNAKTLPITPRIIFPHRLDQSSIPASANEETLWFPMPRPLHDKIQAFSNTVKGFPSRASGGFARMFYFSAVTITTLGYGDIVPTTTRARMLVALESILGVVLIGLFLNSLARETNGAQP